MIIDACRPFGWRNKFAKTSALSLAESRVIEDKWMASLRPAIRS